MSTESNANWQLAAANQRKSPIAPEGASCWICLEEGPDDKGHRLMRNCACRGEASGFAHASCVATYLLMEEKKKSNQSQIGDTCKNCNQPYQGDMALAVAIARLDACEAEGIEHSNQQYQYLREKMYVAACQDDVGNPQEAIKILEESLIIVKSNSTLHYSKRLEFEIMKNMGIFYLKNELDDEKGMGCLQNALDIGRKCGYHKEIEALEPLVEFYSDEKGQGRLASSVVMRRILQERIEKYGKNHDIAFDAVLGLVCALRKEGYLAESLETATSTLRDARPVLGPSHPTTLRLEGLVSEMEDAEKIRHATFVVDIKSDDPKINGKIVQIKRRAKGDDNKYVVQYITGNNERFKARIDQLLLCENLPVTCHGLVNAKHLNEKMGRVKKYHKEVDRYEIFFDDKNIHACLVRPENLSINI